MTRRTSLEAWYLERSYESYLLYWLGQLDTYARAQSIRYSLFGGAAVSAYVGHLVRKLHDIDVLVPPNKMAEVGEFLAAKGFQHQDSVKAAKAGFAKCSRRDHLYEVIVSVFPSRFTLLDVDAEDLPVLDVYDFRRAVDRSQRRCISGVGNDREVEVTVVPIEDLVISRLWPTFEPTTVHDLLLLFASEAATKMDYAYLVEQMQASPVLRQLVLRTLEMFDAKYRDTAWHQLTADPDSCAKTIELLRSHLGAGVR